jgi:hypothetical protein
MIVHTIIDLISAVATYAVYSIDGLTNTFSPSTHASFVLATTRDETKSKQNESEYSPYTTDDDVAVTIWYVLTPVRMQTFRPLINVYTMFWHNESLYELAVTSPSNAANGVRDVFRDVTWDPIVGAVMDLDGDNSSETFTTFRNDAEELKRWPTIRKSIAKDDSIAGHACS